MAQRELEKKVRQLIAFYKKARIRVNVFLGSVWNVIYNNRFSNSLKELGYQIFGLPYDEYIYSETENGYLSFIEHRPFGKDSQLEIRIVPGDVDVKFRIRTSNMKMRTKRKVLKDLAKYFPALKFRLRRFATMETEGKRKLDAIES